LKKPLRKDKLAIALLVEKSIKEIFNYFDRYLWVQKL